VRLSRRRFLGLGAALLGSSWLTSGRAQTQRARSETLRLGLITPTQSPGIAVEASLYEAIGEAARMGAQLAWERLDAEAGRRTLAIELVAASAPNAEAAYRAAQRLVSLERVHALIGGLGAGQAEQLNAVAKQQQLPFFNIGSTNPALRNSARHPFAFHIEASGPMYLRTLAAWYGTRGKRRWFIVGEGSRRGQNLQTQALRAVRAEALEIEVVGTAQVVPEQPAYFNELIAARDASADLILLLLSPKDQIAFLAQQEATLPAVPVALFPDAVAQTRDYIAAAQYRAKKTGSGYRAMLWEATLEAHGAQALNDAFTSRWGKPMDAPAWAAYQAVTILAQAATSVQTAGAAELLAYLTSPKVTFDVQKGSPVRFRPADQQLLQPLYMIKVNPEARWGLSAEQQLSVAQVAGEVTHPY
jgi:ABC transporter substrate binding protein (PQQ-dependent alcohol dehydrogenase system)